MVGVTGSIPVAPTIFPRPLKHFRHHTRADRFELIAIQQPFNSKERPLGTLRKQRHDAIGCKRDIGTVVSDPSLTV